MLQHLRNDNWYNFKIYLFNMQERFDWNYLRVLQTYFSQEMWIVYWKLYPGRLHELHDQLGVVFAFETFLAFDLRSNLCPICQLQPKQAVSRRTLIKILSWALRTNFSNGVQIYINQLSMYTWEYYSRNHLFYLVDLWMFSVLLLSFVTPRF